MSRRADARPGIASLRVRLPHELLGARAAGTSAVLQGAGGGVSRHRGLHTEAPRGERAAEDSLLPGGAGVLHQGYQTGSTQGRNPDHKESTLVTVYRVSERCSLKEQFTPKTKYIFSAFSACGAQKTLKNTFDKLYSTQDNPQTLL